MGMCRGASSMCGGRRGHLLPPLCRRHRHVYVYVCFYNLVLFCFS